MLANTHPLIKLPTLPLFGIAEDPWSQVSGDARLLRRSDITTWDATPYPCWENACSFNYAPQYAENIRHYWEAHRSDPDSNIYYAYYTLFIASGLPCGSKARNLLSQEENIAAVYRLGETIEPKNALYNLLGATAKAAEARGISTRLEKDRNGWRTGTARENARSQAELRNHGSLMANILLSPSDGTLLSEQ